MMIKFWFWLKAVQFVASNVECTVEEMQSMLFLSLNIAFQIVLIIHLYITSSSWFMITSTKTKAMGKQSLSWEEEEPPSIIPSMSRCMLRMNSGAA